MLCIELCVKQFTPCLTIVILNIFVHSMTFCDACFHSESEAFHVFYFIIHMNRINLKNIKTLDNWIIFCPLFGIKLRSYKNERCCYTSVIISIYEPACVYNASWRHQRPDRMSDSDSCWSRLSADRRGITPVALAAHWSLRSEPMTYQPIKGVRRSCEWRLWGCVIVKLSSSVYLIVISARAHL